MSEFIELRDLISTVTTLEYLLFIYIKFTKKSKCFVDLGFVLKYTHPQSLIYRRIIRDFRTIDTKYYYYYNNTIYGVAIYTSYVVNYIKFAWNLFDRSQTIGLCWFDVCVGMRVTFFIRWVLMMINIITYVCVCVCTLYTQSDGRSKAASTVQNK